MRLRGDFEVCSPKEILSKIYVGELANDIVQKLPLMDDQYPSYSVTEDSRTRIAGGFEDQIVCN